MKAELASELAQDIREKRDVRSMRGVVDELAAAYEIQDLVYPQLGPCCGRKIGLNGATQMQALGLKQPIVGHILGNHPLADGTQLSRAAFATLALEPEFVAVIGADISAGPALTGDQLLEKIERFSLGFEVLDRRNSDADVFVPTFIVNNVFNAGVVVAQSALDIDDISTGSYTAKFTAAGAVKLDGTATAPQNPVEAALFLVNHFRSRGQAIAKGEVILCGAHHPPLTIEENGIYRFELGSGSAVSLSISD